MTTTVKDDLADAVLHPQPGNVNFTIRSGETSSQDCYWCGGEIEVGQGIEMEVETSPGRKRRVAVHADPCAKAMEDDVPF